jgi:hypothetical protein
MLILLLVSFFVMIGTLGLVIYLDMKPQVAEGNYNYVDGSAHVSTPDATATHQENRANGEISARAALNGLGKAEASAELGHEFQYTGKEQRRFKLKVQYGYRTHVQVDEGPAQSRAIVNVVLLPDTVNVIADDVQIAVGRKDNPTPESLILSAKEEPTELSKFLSLGQEQGGQINNPVVSGIQEFPISLKRNQKCRALLKVAAIAEVPDEAQKGKCHAEVVGKVSRISLVPQ